MLVLNEVKQAKDIIANGTVGKKPSATIALLAKYYRQKENKNAKDTINILNEFMQKNYVFYNKVLWTETIEKMAKFGKKYNLRELDGVDVYESEMNKISELKDLRTKKVMFTLMCIAKVYNATNESNNNWVNTSEGDIFKSAHVNTSQSIGKAKLIHNLKEEEFISFSNKNENLNIKVNIINEDISDENPVILTITDLRDLGYVYENFYGLNKFRKCKICNRLIKVGSKQNNDYCKEHAGYQPMETKKIICIDCGKEIEIDSKNNKTCRCEECQHEVDKKIKREYWAKTHKLEPAN